MPTEAETAVMNEELSPEVTASDREAFQEITTTALTAEQAGRVRRASRVEPRQAEVLGVHWHPEFIPAALIAERMAAMFPHRQVELIIPTQHNELLEWDDLAGVEIDCFSTGFNRKVQLLAHFSGAKAARADVLRSMLSHTREYRASQLFELIDSMLEPRWEDRVRRAAAKTGAGPELVQFVRVHVSKLKRLLDEHLGELAHDMVKNKLVRNYLHAYRDRYPAELIGRAQVFVRAVKNIVKAQFSPSYFYRTEEIIEEVRGLGGGLVIPHPEQFWPILLAEYDMDGIEVWNPQSREYTEFLIHVVNQQNRARHGRRLLTFMGDDTHFGEKVLPPAYQEPDKAGRELGLQPAWDEPAIRKGLCIAGVNRRNVIEEYRQRLG
jgi:hypothetical protein